MSSCYRFKKKNYFPYATVLVHGRYKSLTQKNYLLLLQNKITVSVCAMCISLDEENIVFNKNSAGV
jgi:hypothetical protein